MKSRCFRRDCPWVLEVAHMDEAVDQLRQHYRAVHPTKAFYERHALENLETYNLTADECLDRHAFSEPGAAAPEYDWRGFKAEVRRYRQYQDRGDDLIDEETLIELERRVEAHDAEQAANPQPVEQNDPGVMPPLGAGPGPQDPFPVVPRVVLFNDGNGVDPVNVPIEDDEYIIVEN